MATYALGITAAWAGVSLGEVQSIKATVGNGLPMGRSCNWSNEPGLVEIACLSSVALSSTNYGVMATLQLAGGGMAVGPGGVFTTKAVLERFDALGTLADGNGDVTRYSAALRLVSVAGTATTL